MSLRDEILAEEGAIPFIYLDTLGNPTCGVGVLLTKASDVERFRWSDMDQARQDYSNAKVLNASGMFGVKWPAWRYAALNHARMQDPTEGLSDRLSQLEGTLERQWYGFNGLPEGVKTAVLDMAYNLGVAGLLKGFPKMVAALGVHSWSTAASQSHRKGISDARNLRTYNRILAGV